MDLPTSPPSPGSDPNAPFMKGPKRKRLAKACDACHKSKRRCDGTAPCSNCYFASKKCTYTDASGKRVPAPRPLHPDRPKNGPDIPCPSHSDRVTAFPSIVAVQANDASLSGSPSEDDRARAKRIRTNIPTPSGTPPRSLAPPLLQHAQPLERDHALTRELVHLFFAYRQPQRMIIHQPSFLTALTHGTVPKYLLLAVCAVAAPLSKQPCLKTSPCRYAGEVFAQEAVSLMFDKNHQLVCEHNLATAQSLLLLQLSDRMGKSLWVGQHYQLALEIVTKLGIFDTDSTALTLHSSLELIDTCIERECARRVFWLILISDCFGWMLYRRPHLATDSQMNLRLPIDETSFEVSPLTAMPEFIAKPTSPYSVCSESGQLIRLLLLHEEIERLVEDLNECEGGRDPLDRLREIETKVGGWMNALPEHMRFTDDNLWVHITQYDTASNMGAWCFFITHVIYCSCILALYSGRQRCRMESPSNPTWAQERILKIIEALGRKAKLSIFLGVAIWPLFKYVDGPPSKGLLSWSSDFEEIWGVRMQDLSQHQSGQQLRTQVIPPPMPSPLITRFHVPRTPTEPVSPVSRTGSDASTSLPMPSVRTSHDASAHSSSSSSYLESRVQIGHDAREKDVGHMVNDADIDPALQTVSDGRLQAPSQSLPSLKASGLLEWPRPSSDTIAVPPSMSWQPSSPHLTPARQLRRDSAPAHRVQRAPAPAPAPATSSGMPVGLQWLAHEPSTPRSS